MNEKLNELSPVSEVELVSRLRRNQRLGEVGLKGPHRKLVISRVCRLDRYGSSPDEVADNLISAFDGYPGDSSKGVSLLAEYTIPKVVAKIVPNEQQRQEVLAAIDVRFEALKQE